MSGKRPMFGMGAHVWRRVVGGCMEHRIEAIVHEDDGSYSYVITGHPGEEVPEKALYATKQEAIAGQRLNPAPTQPA